MPLGNVTPTTSNNRPAAARPVAPSKDRIRGSYGAKPPVVPKGMDPEKDLPTDVLEINGRIFGKGAKYGDIRPLLDGVKAEDAAKVGRNDGIDKIFFTDESGKSFVFYVERAHLSDLQAGYYGRFNGKRVHIDAVDDEANTFTEGFQSVWNWLGHVLRDSFGSEASNRISGLMGTTFGTLIAAAALKTTTNPTPVNAIRTIGGTVEALSGGAVNAITSLLRTSASVVMVLLAAIGSLSLVAGVRAHFARADYRQLDMLTGHY